MHVVAQGGGGKRTPFCRRMAVKAFHAHRDNMQESQDYAADSVGLMRFDQVTEAAVFLFSPSCKYGEILKGFICAKHGRHIFIVVYHYAIDFASAPLVLFTARSL